MKLRIRFNLLTTEFISGTGSGNGSVILSNNEDAFKMLPWPKNSPEGRGSEVLKQETRP